jgi:protein TonB
MLLPLLLISISIFSIRVHAKEKIETKINAISESIFQKKIDTSKPTPPPPSLNEMIRTTKATVFVDGKEANKAELAKSLKPNEVSDIKFFSAEEATKKYGDKGKYGSIEIAKGKVVSKKKETDSSIVMHGNGKKIIKPGDSLTSEKETRDYDKVFIVSQEPASFPGGLPTWVKYLEQNLNIDIPVKNGAPAGKYTVVLSFIVDKNGGVSDVKAETDPGYGTAEEAKRVILKGPNWIPAVQNGLKVIYKHKQSITFVVAAK